MAALHLNILSLALIGASAVAFCRQRRAVRWACHALFVPVAAAGSVLTALPISPVLAVLIPAVFLGLPLLTMLLYAVDRVFAVFCVETAHLALICWLLWPPLVFINFVLLLLR